MEGVGVSKLKALMEEKKGGKWSKMIGLYGQQEGARIRDDRKGLGRREGIWKEGLSGNPPHCLRYS